MDARLPTHAVHFSFSKMALVSVGFDHLYWKSGRLGEWLEERKEQEDREVFVHTLLTSA